MEEPRAEIQDVEVDKDRFDAVLRKMIATKPLPLKEIVATSNLRRAKQGTTKGASS
jgi:hypothetical protein